MDLTPLLLPARIGRLTELAYNLWWSWHPEARALFAAIDPTVWAMTAHNPQAVGERLGGTGDVPGRYPLAGEDAAVAVDERGGDLRGADVQSDGGTRAVAVVPPSRTHGQQEPL